jgi:hypothetical protein
MTRSNRALVTLHQEIGIMTAKEQVLIRYPDAICFKYCTTQLYEIFIPSRIERDGVFLVWNCATPQQAWKQGLEYLNQELLRKFES